VACMIIDNFNFKIKCPMNMFGSSPSRTTENRAAQSPATNQT